MTTIKDAVAYMERYQDNFELFAGEVLGMKISEDQRMIVEGLQERHFVSAKSGTGCGKSQPLSTLVLTPTGYVPMGTLTVGDSVIGSDGKPTQVVGVFPQGELTTYTVGFSDGSSVRCSLDHLWDTQDALERRYKKPHTTKTTEEIKRTLTRGKENRKNHSIQMVSAVELQAQEVTLDPYLMGVLLGDGGLTSGGVRFSSGDAAIVAAVRERIPVTDSLKYATAYDYRINGCGTMGRLRDYGLMGKKSDTKFVPKAYLQNTIDVRLKVLQGLMDTDGTLNYDTGTSAYYVTTSKQLAEDVRYLVQSLGGVATTKEKTKTYTYLGEIRTGKLAYYVTVNLPKEYLPFLLGKKSKVYKPHSWYVPIRFITSVTADAEKEECQCIRVAAADSLYVTEECIVTHNTAICAVTALWFFTTRPEAKVVCTAPTGHQLSDLLFSEIESWIRRIKIPFIKDAINVINGKVYMTGYKDWYIVGRTIPKDSKDKLGDVLAGFHAPHLMFIIDEASAVPDAVYSGIEGSMMQINVKALMVGNPTRPSGYFYDSHNKSRDQWCNVTLSSLRSPFNNMDWIERMRILHGEDSDWYRTKCLGEFPSGAGMVIANYDQIQESFERHKDYDLSELEGKRVAGLDPSAGRNDSSVLTIRQGNYCWEPIRINHRDGPDLLPKVISICKREGVKEVYLDYNGIGIILYDLLRRDKTKTFRLFKVDSNTRANDPEGYRNLRAELYSQLSNNFDELAIADHDRYVAELPEIAFMEDKEPIQVMPKPAIKSRLGFSPDFADSLMLSTFRHFNFGSTSCAVYDTVAFEAMNNQLTYESEFEKI